MRRQRRQIVGVMIHIMTIAGLAGPAVTAPVMGDHAKAFAQEKKHLRVPIVGRERPAVTENDRLSAAPVLVVNLGAVLGLDRRHGEASFGRANSGAPALSMPNDAADQANVGIDRNRLTAPMITMMKNTSTTPWTTANGGSLGGTLGASACNGPTFRKLWITSTNTLR